MAKKQQLQDDAGKLYNVTIPQLEEKYQRAKNIFNHEKEKSNKVRDKAQKQEAEELKELEAENVTLRAAKQSRQEELEQLKKQIADRNENI